MDIAGAGVDVDDSRRGLADRDVSGADIAVDRFAAEAGEITVAAPGVAGERPGGIARRHVARSGVRLDLPLHRGDRDVAARRVESDLAIDTLPLERPDQVPKQ